MTALTRLALSAVFLALVGLMDPYEGWLAFRSAGEALTGLLNSMGTGSASGMALASFSGEFSVQRPGHELLQFAAQAFGYPVSSSLHLSLTLTGMLIVGAGVMLRCRRD
jgi:hypothetical protein